MQGTDKRTFWLESQLRVMIFEMLTGQSPLRLSPPWAEVLWGPRLARRFADRSVIEFDAAMVGDAAADQNYECAVTCAGSGEAIGKGGVGEVGVGGGWLAEKRPAALIHEVSQDDGEASP